MEDENDLTAVCKRCGKSIDKLSSSVPMSDYCRKCFEEFSEAMEEGAIIVEKHVSGSWNGYMIYSDFKSHERSVDLSKVEAFVLGREIGEQGGVDVLFKDQPKDNVWFMDNYLKAHPEIEKKVIEIEDSKRDALGRLVKKIKNLF